MPILSGKSPLDYIDAKILAILEKFSFKPARSMAETLLVNHTTVLLHFHQSLGFHSFHLYWAPQVLTDELRGKQREYTNAMLPFLHAAERDGWHYFVTGDESWFS
jgi:hypothetical protein